MYESKVDVELWQMRWCLSLVYRDSHTAVVLGHGNEHVVIISKIFCSRVEQVHMG